MNDTQYFSCKDNHGIFVKLGDVIQHFGMPEDYWEVEKILDSKVEKKRNFYLVRWKGWDSSNDSWEPEENVEHTNAFNIFKGIPF